MGHTSGERCARPPERARACVHRAGAFSMMSLLPADVSRSANGTPADRAAHLATQLDYGARWKFPPHIDHAPRPPAFARRETDRNRVVCWKGRSNTNTLAHPADSCSTERLRPASVVTYAKSRPKLSRVACVGSVRSVARRPS